MKKILFIIAGLLLLSSCLDNDTMTSEDVQKKPEVIKVSPNGIIDDGIFEYVEIDGHTYLMYGDYSRGGITHSGTCPCNNSNKIEEK